MRVRDMTDHERTFFRGLQRAARLTKDKVVVEKIKAILDDELAFTLAAAQACDEAGCNDSNIFFDANGEERYGLGILEGLMLLATFIMDNWPKIQEIIDAIIDRFVPRN